MLYPKLTWRVPVTENKIFLTFDDGPVPGPTDFVLEQLNKYNAKGTFFCIGNNAAINHSLLMQVREGGHSVGNHTFNHTKGWSTSDAMYSKDISDCQDIVGNTSLFRPPFGRIKRSQINRLPNYKIIMWDVLTYDYLQSLNRDRCLRGAIGATRKGSIIVFHDSYKAEKNMRYVLPRFLEHFAQQNFTFDALPEQ